MSFLNATDDTSNSTTDDCHPSNDEINQAYNLGLHVGSIFILLAVSLLGAFLAVASIRIKWFHIPPVIVNIGKFFGSGVVLSTGFIHILPDAMEALTDPCLPDSWNVYGSYAGLFAMLATLGMQLIEFLSHQQIISSGKKHVHVVAHIDRNDFKKSGEVEHDHDCGPTPTIDDINQTECVDNVCDNDGDLAKQSQVNVFVENAQNVKKTTKRRKKHDEKYSYENKIRNSIDHQHDHKPEREDHHDCVTIDVIQMEGPSKPVELYETAGHSHGIALQDPDRQHKISTYLLELGIALHSVLIGLTLGTATDSFIALLIALCFHQFFEAFALGAQIAKIKDASARTAILMVVFFALTTPVGIAIGVGIHVGSYNPKATSTLIATGILDALAAGILIYVALVNLITAEMGASAHTFHSLKAVYKILYFTALYLGAGVMAVIGRWA